MPRTNPLPDTHAAVARLQALTDLVATRRRQLAAEADLTETQWRALEEISTEHFLPSLFARRRDCSAAAISRTLRQLQELGLVRVRRGDTDGRERHYSLTAAGRQRLDRIRTARHHALASAWSNIPADDIAAFVRFADPLIQRLEDLVDAGRDAPQGGGIAARS